MARQNVPRKAPPAYTHEGGPAQHINPEQHLQRSVMACLLWEGTFYESGDTIADRIAELVPRVAPDKVARMALKARTDMKLRHVPLLLVREMARHDSHKHLVADLTKKIIQRPDEMAELVAIYMKGGRTPLSSQLKKGLAAAFNKFDAYQLSKWNRDGTYTLRDVMFLCHPKPADKAQGALWKKLVDGTLEPPDTWEVGLSAGHDKKEVWTRLLREGKLPPFALIKNLRNMRNADVDANLVIGALDKMNVGRILPYRFVTAARAIPELEPHLENAMMRALADVEKLPGKTALLIDVSGSMDAPISSNQSRFAPRTRNAMPPMTRMDAACGLAILARELCESVRVFTFSEQFVEVAGRRGFGLRDAIIHSQPHRGTFLGAAIRAVYSTGRVRPKGSMYADRILFHGANMDADRLIVFTDEQAHDDVAPPPFSSYMVNVSSDERGVGYRGWSAHITGFSEAIMKYIAELEGAGLDNLD